MPAVYIGLRHQSLIGLGAYRGYQGYRGVAVPAADWLRSLQEVRWIFSPRVWVNWDKSGGIWLNLVRSGYLGNPIFIRQGRFHRINNSQPHHSRLKGKIIKMLIQESYKDVATQAGGDIRELHSWNWCKILTKIVRYLRLSSNYRQLPASQVPRCSGIQRDIPR